MTDIPVNVPISLTDRLTGGLKKLTAPVGGLTKQIEKTTGALSKLGAQKKDIERFAKLKAGVAATDKAMEAARAQIKKLGKELAATKNPSKQLTAQFDKSRTKLKTLKEAQLAEARALDQVRGKLKASGISTKQLGDAKAKLSRAIIKENQLLNRQTNALKRVSDARDRMKRNNERALKVGAAGAATTAVGYGARRAITGLTDPIRGVERARGELATLGVKDLDLITARGREMQAKVAGVSAASFITAAYDIRSGISSLTDEGVAAMTASAVTVAKATKAMPEQMTSLFATSYGIFKKQFNDMGDADFGDMFGAVLAKSVQQFKTDGGKMQQAIESAGAFAANLGMGMQEQMAVLGMMQTSMQAGESGTALRAFAENAAKAQEGFDDLAKEAGGNPVRVRVVDENGALRSMPDILSDLKARYGETLDAFESAEIKKSFGTTEALKLVNTLWGQEEAVRANTDALREAGGAGASFTEAMAKAADNNFDSRMTLLGQQLDVLKQKFADQLVPVLDKVIPKVGAFVATVGDWIDRNPKLATGLGAVLVSVAGLASTLGPLMLGASSLVATFGAFNFGIVKIATSLPMIGAAFAKLGALLLANPIGLAIAGLAGAAYLIWDNWDWIKEKFIGLWAAVKTGVSAGWEGIKTLFLNYTPHGLIIKHWDTIAETFVGFGGDILRGLANGIGGGVQLVKTAITSIGSSITSTFKSLLGIASPSSVFADFGGWIMDGLKNGLAAKIQQLKDAVTGIGSNVTGWFKRQLGIKSPSRVFMGLGGHVSEGLAIGISRGEGSVVAKMDRIRARIAAPIAAPSGGAQGAQLTPLAAAAFATAATFTAEPGNAAPQGGGGSVVYQPTYTITITVEGGGAADDGVARQIREALAEHDARAQAELRRLLND